MGEFQHKPGQFTLFKNNKDGNEARPDYTGLGADFEGNPIKVSAWLKDGAKGKFMSCKFELKDARQVPKAKPNTAKADGFPDDSDTIPF